MSRPLTPGDTAPEFTLTAVNRSTPVSLRDYLGRSALLVALFRGLHCPFCRRNIVQLGAAQPRLRAEGVEILAIVTTPAERARLYFGHRPTPVTLASDPDATTHEAFGVPGIELVAAAGTGTAWPRTTLDELSALKVNPTGELPAPQPIFEAIATLQAKDGYQMTPADQQTSERHGLRLTGYFLLDRRGVVRWSLIEARDRMTDVARLPDEAALLAAVGTLAG